MEQRKLCRTFLSYDRACRYYFPLKQNEKFFLCAEEDDFILDGYSIRRFRDVWNTEVKDDICLEIAVKEGLIDHIIVPSIDISDWETIFTDLQKNRKNIIVEHESPDDNASQFVIGHIESVYSRVVYVRHFTGDGIWEPVPYRIPYSSITSVTFGSRYIEIFSKYLPPLPDNFAG
jgi:hypothetical protein